MRAAGPPRALELLRALVYAPHEHCHFQEDSVDVTVTEALFDFIKSAVTMEAMKHS